MPTTFSVPPATLIVPVLDQLGEPPRVKVLPEFTRIVPVFVRFVGPTFSVLKLASALISPWFTSVIAPLKTLPIEPLPPITVLIDPVGPMVSVPAVPFISTRQPVPSNKMLPARICPGAKPSELPFPLRCALANVVPPSIFTRAESAARVRSPLIVTPVNRPPIDVRASV